MRTLPARPLSPTEIIETALRVFRVTAAPVTLAVLVAYAPLNLLTSLSGTVLEPFDPSRPPPPPGTLLVALLGLVASVAVGPFVTAAVTWVVLQRERGREVGWEDAYRAAAGRYRRLLGAVVLILLATVVAIVAIVLPALLVAVAAPTVGVLFAVAATVLVILAVVVLYYLAVPVILVEDAGAWDALARSARLVRPRPWATLATVVMSAVLLLIAAAVPAVLLGSLAATAGPAAFVLRAVGSTLGGIVTVPVAANVALLLYLDARLRQDGADPATVAAALPA